MIPHKKSRPSDSTPGYSVVGWILFVIVVLYLGVLTFPPRIPGGCGILSTPGDLNRLAESIERFEEEYARLPNPPSLDLETEGPQAAELITVLLGKEDTASSMQNPRQIAFLCMRTTKDKRMGSLVYSPENKVVGIYDAWGNPLRAILRPPGQTAITLPYRGEQITVSKPVAVLSRGPDKKWGTKDDLKSWEDPK